MRGLSVRGGEGRKVIWIGLLVSLNRVGLGGEGLLVGWEVEKDGLKRMVESNEFRIKGSFFLNGRERKMWLYL